MINYCEYAYFLLFFVASAVLGSASRSSLRYAVTTDPISKHTSKLIDLFWWGSLRPGASWEMFLSRLAAHPDDAS